MFKFETDKGTYAIKVLNPEVMSRSDAYSTFVISETISNLAKDNEIIVSSALLIDGNYLTKYDDMYYMVFGFVNGKTLTDNEITIEHCRKIGKNLSQIHSLDYQNLKLKNKRVCDISLSLNSRTTKSLTYFLLKIKDCKIKNRTFINKKIIYFVINL